MKKIHELEKRTPRRRDLIRINYDESKIPLYRLPLLLVGSDGKKIATAEQWENSRRREIMDFYRSEYYGKMPPVPDEFSWRVVSENSNALNGSAIRKEIQLDFGMKNGRRHSFLMLVYIPKNRPPMPVFCGLNFRGNHTTSNEADVIPTGYALDGKLAFPDERGANVRRWQFSEAVKRGYAVATACYHDIFPDFRNALGSWEKSIYGMFFPGVEASIIHQQYSAIGAWSWALQRMLDVLEHEPLVDASRAAVSGHSRLGKTSLWTGANDKRFKIVIANNSGHGGAALIRRFYGETNEVLARSFPHWFVDNFRKYIGENAVLPHDQHFLTALIAPRKLCIGSAVQDRWADPRGEFLSGVHASEVYRLYKLTGLPATEMPEPEKPVFGDISYQIRNGKHDIILTDWEFYWSVADRLWK